MYSNGDSYHHTYNESYENIGQEKEEEKDKEEYKEEEVNDVGRYAKLYEENIGFVNQLVSEWLIYISENIDIELFKRAIEVAIDRGHVNKGYINGIINKWITNNIRSLKDLNAYEVSSKNKGDRINGKSRCIKELEDEPIYQKPSKEQIREIQRLLQ
nr:DnaD domain protein [Romboutsia sp. D33t1_170424_H2]